MECPLNSEQQSEGPFSAERSAKQQFYSEVQIPDECWPCVQYAEKLPEEFTSSMLLGNCTHLEYEDEATYHDLDLVILPGTPHRYIQEESGRDYGCEQDECSGVLGRYITRFECRREI